MTTRAEKAAEEIVSATGGGLYPGGRAIALEMAAAGYRRGLDEAANKLWDITRNNDHLRRATPWTALWDARDALLVMANEEVIVPVPFDR